MEDISEIHAAHYMDIWNLIFQLSEAELMG